MIKLILKSIYDEEGILDCESILEEKLIEPHLLAKCLVEYSNHPLMKEHDVSLIVTPLSDNEIEILLYNGYLE